MFFDSFAVQPPAHRTHIKTLDEECAEGSEAEENSGSRWHLWAGVEVLCWSAGWNLNLHFKPVPNWPTVAPCLPEDLHHSRSLRGTSVDWMTAPQWLRHPWSLSAMENWSDSRQFLPHPVSDSHQFAFRTNRSMENALAKGLHCALSHL